MSRRDWRGYFVYTKTSLKTTWKLRVGSLAIVIVAAFLTRGVWVTQIGQSLVCAQDLAPSDVILVENFDPTYLVFERAAALESAGLAPRTLVMVEITDDSAAANLISSGLAELMARHARLRNWDLIPIKATEPVSLTAAVQIREYLATEGIRSLIVVTRAFRSRRSALVYGAVLGGVGMQVHCLPVFVTRRAERWADTWHGIQEVGEQFVKLQFYRFYVLPFSSRSLRSSTARRPGPEADLTDSWATPPVDRTAASRDNGGERHG